MNPAVVHSERQPAPSRARELASLAFVALLAFLFDVARLHFNDEFGPGSLLRVAGLAEPAAATPFQYRVLTPWLVRALHSAVGGSLSPLTLLRAVDVVALVGAWLALRSLARRLFASEADAHWTAFLALALLPFHFVFSREYPFWYAWDLTSFAVFSVGLALLERRAWLAYYVLFALGTLNRETTCFLTLVHATTAWKSTPRARLFAHLAAQVTLWIALKLALRELYTGSRGADIAQWTWRENWDALRDPASWRWYLLAFGGTWIPLVLFFRRIASPWIRAALVACVPMLVGLFLVGVWTELRIFGELIPIVALGLTALVRARDGAAVSSGSAPSAT